MALFLPFTALYGTDISDPVIIVVILVVVVVNGIICRFSYHLIVMLCVL